MITIKECGEPLINIKIFCKSIVLNNDSISYKDLKQFYLRKTVAKKLSRAIKLLPSGVKFKIMDAWRPQYIQRKFFTIYKIKFSRIHNSWSKKRILKEVKKYVDPYKGKYASAHLTGGAIDITLWKNGKKLPMNSLKISFQDNAKTFQKKLPLYIKRNRRILINSLKKVGFSNNQKEYWHWSYGDIHWAKREHKKVAIYGIIKGHK